MRQLSLPLVATIIGSIAAIKELEANSYEVLRRDTYAVTVQSLTGELTPVWVSKAQVDEYGLAPVMFLGNIVSISINKNIKDETYYVDSDGENIPHDETFDSFVNMVSLMPVNMALSGVPQFIIEDLVKQRNERAANVIEAKPKFHASRNAEFANVDDHIAALKVKHDATTNPVIQQSIMARMVSLGYKAEPNNAKPEKVK